MYFIIFGLPSIEAYSDLILDCALDKCYLPIPVLIFRIDQPSWL